MLAGFVDSEVTAQPDSTGQNLTLRVVEGTRYLTGPIQFSGVKDSLLTQLVKTDQYKTFTKNEWQVDQPAPYQDPLPQHYRRFAQRILSEVGYFLSDLDVSFKINQDLHKVFRCCDQATQGQRSFSVRQI